MIKFISFEEGKRWGQNRIKKKWDIKYPIPSLFQGRQKYIKERGDF